MSAARRKSVTDMTVGDPMKLILNFVVPLLGGMLFQQLYSCVDTLIVGRFLGVSELAGVGSTGSINFLIVGFCMGVCSGFAIPISQQFGAKKYSEMRRYLVHSIYLSIVFAVICTLLSVVFCGQILTLMNTPSDIYEYAYDYIIVIFLGIPTVFLYNLCSGAVRALGDSKMPVVFLIISSVLNIFLDLAFILIFHMGVAGAAWATDISQLISGLIAAVYMIRRIDILRIEKGEWKYQQHYINVLLAMGVPMGLQYSITAIGSVILQTAVNGLGSVYIAAQTAAGKVSMFFCIPFDALGTTMATWGGQNVGAGKLDRVRHGCRDASILGCVYAAAEFVIMFFFGRGLASIFITSTAENASVILDASRLFLIVTSAFHIPLAFVNIVRFLIQGMGYSGLATLSGVFEMIGRSVAAFGLVPVFGYIGACFASPIAWVLADIFLFTAYAHVYKKTARILAQKNGGKPSETR